MRTRCWILYSFSHTRHDLVIRKDTRTPLYRLDQLDHVVGVYKSKEEAYNKGIGILNARIKTARQNMKELAK